MRLHFLCCMTADRQNKVVHCQSIYDKNSNKLNMDVLKNQLNQHNSTATLTSTLEELSNVICFSVKLKEQVRNSNLLDSLKLFVQSKNTDIQKKSLEVLVQLVDVNLIKSDLAEPHFLIYLKKIISNTSHKSREEAVILYSKIISQATFSLKQIREEVNDIKKYINDTNPVVCNAALRGLKECLQEKKVPYEYLDKHDLKSQLIPLLDSDFSDIKLNTLDILNIFVKNDYLKECILRSVELNTILNLFQEGDCKQGVLEFSYHGILLDSITPLVDKNCKFQMCLIDSLTDDRDDVRMSALKCLIEYSKNRSGYKWLIIGAILPLAADTSDSIRQLAVSKIQVDFNQDDVKEHFRQSVIIENLKDLSISSRPAIRSSIAIVLKAIQ